MENNHASPPDNVPVDSTSPEQDLHTRSHPPLLTVDETIARLGVFTPEQRSLAWSPEPPFESMGAADCRRGGSCGLDFNRETPRARWVQARHRWNREQKRLQKDSSAGGETDNP